MQIEVLTRKTEKKANLVTLLVREQNLTATGDTLKVPGTILQIAEEYLLLNISSTHWTQRIMPLLFSIAPLGGAGQLYEPVTDMKIVVTARCYEPVKLLPYLHEVSHLDLDRGELLGIRLKEWRSRDITIVARAELAVQSNVLTARIKFSTHSRDSQYNCQLCIDQVSLEDILGPLCPEFTKPPLAMKIGDLMIRSQQRLTAQEWASLINQYSIPLKYCHQNDNYQVDLPGAGLISFHRPTNQEEILCQMELWQPGVLATDLLRNLIQGLKIEKLSLFHTAENIVLYPGLLVDQFAFRKMEEYHLFALQTEHFRVTYNVKNLYLELTSTIDLADSHYDPSRINIICQEIKQFMQQVVAYATTDD